MTAASKSERFEARLTLDQRFTLERAAALKGRTLTDFVIASAIDAAEEALRTQVLILSARDSLAFAQALLVPPAEPNDALLAAGRAYVEMVETA